MYMYIKEHFDLLRKFAGKPYGKNNPDHNKADEKLREAYDVTLAWANKLSKEMFKEDGGYVKIRRSSHNANQQYKDHQWAKIYPKCVF